jgi:hypothetical protein
MYKCEGLNLSLSLSLSHVFVCVCILGAAKGVSARHASYLLISCLAWPYYETIFLFITLVFPPFFSLSLSLPLFSL